MAREDQWADQFSQDVDRLLQEAGRAEPDPTPDDYPEMLDVARQLAQADWSGESQVKETLRRQLLQHAAERAEAPGNQPRPATLALSWAGWRRRLGTVTAAAGTALLLGVMLLWPGTLTGTAQGLETFVQRVVLRRPVTMRVIVVSEPALPPSSQLRVRSTSPDQVVLMRERLAPVMFFTDDGNLWTMKTPIGSFGGRVPVGYDVTVKRFISLEEAQAALGYRLRQPGYLPQGYTLRDTAITPLDAAYMFYRGPNADIILAQMRMERDVWEEPAGATALATLTDKPVRIIRLEGRVGSWIEGRGLIWQVDDTSYLVGGTGLDLDEATRIATSLK